MSMCEHNGSVGLERHYRRTLSGHMEADGKAVTCQKCGDRWFFRDRRQLPDWLRAELIRLGL